MNIVDKLREWQRGEREWGQADMVRECLVALLTKDAIISEYARGLAEVETMVKEARHG